MPINKSSNDTTVHSNVLSVIFNQRGNRLLEEGFGSLLVVFFSIWVVSCISICIFAALHFCHTNNATAEGRQKC